MQRKQRTGSPLVSAAAGAADAGGISDDNGENMVKGQVGDPSVAQTLQGKVSSCLHSWATSIQQSLLDSASNVWEPRVCNVTKAFFQAVLCFDGEGSIGEELRSFGGAGRCRGHYPQQQREAD